MFPALKLFAANCDPSFFGIPSWYHYLYKAGKLSGTCAVNNTFKLPGDLLLVGFGVLDILLRLAGLIAVGFIIYGGIQYVTSEGSPDKTKHAQGTIINALVGMVIAIMAAGAINFIGTQVAK